MKQPRGIQEYGQGACCPDEYNHVPNITGSHELDSSIMRNNNKDMHQRLEDHIAIHNRAYAIGNGYTQRRID